MENLVFGLSDEYFLNEEDTDPLHTDSESKDELRMAPDYYRLRKDGTPLHRAIRMGCEGETDEILTVYQTDFDKIGEYLVKKHGWDPDDKIWMRKTNLIANSEESCKKCKTLEESSAELQDLESAIFVVLKSPINGEEVAVLHPNENNRLDLFRLIRTLLPNGCLSWNYSGLQTDPNGKDETFVETAASFGRHDLITRLYELGAELALPGHNALIAACTALQKDTIHWLLTKHFDHFDFTQRNKSGINAFHVLLQKGKIELMDYVVQKMISYRVKHLQETESQAFNSIFHCVDNDSLSTLSLMKKGRQKIEEYIVKYELDLSYQRKNETILEDVLEAKLALDYCWETIRKHPTLLGLTVYEGTTIVHVCIQLGYLDFLKEMYGSHPEVKQYFETEGSFGCLEGLLFRKSHDAAAFVLENHGDFFLNNLDRVKEEVVLSIYNLPDFYEANGELLAKYFPTLKIELEEKTTEPEFYPGQDFQMAFQRYNLQFEESTITAKDPTQSLNTIIGCKGLTLLHYAVDKDNTKMCLNLLNDGCDFDAVDAEGNHPIHFVKSIEMLDFIIERHPDGRSLVRRTNSQGQTILHRIFSFSIDCEPLNGLIEKIISYGADVNLQDNQGESVVFLIGSDTQLDILRKYNLNLELVNREGESVLERHMKYKNVGLACELLSLLHKEPSFKDHAHKYLELFMYCNRDEFSCDYQPFLEENPETTKLIFDSVYRHSREEASRLFCLACGYNFITEKFLEFDYDLDYNYQDDQDGDTPIIGLLSMEELNEHHVRQLLAKGVDLEKRNNWGQTALMTLVDRFVPEGWSGNDASTVQLLLDHGASIDSADKEDGNTALHLAFKNHDLELAEVLIENGANLAVRNKIGKTPPKMLSKMLYELVKFIE